MSRSNQQRAVTSVCVILTTVVLVHVGSADTQVSIVESQKLTPENIVTGDRIGYSVAISDDGNTALIGALTAQDNFGLAYVFVRSGGVWKSQALLFPYDEVGYGFFGCSVALSADGNIALIGAYMDNDSNGAAYIFRRSGTEWTETTKFVQSTAGGRYGYAVALSNDGNTALVGRPNYASGVGAASVLALSDGVYKLQATLVPTPHIGASAFGTAVALSDDGNTALVGARGDYSGIGAAYVFARSGGIWTQPGVKLYPDPAVGAGRFGYSVALSGDGNFALIGALDDNSSIGAAYLFTSYGGLWPQPGIKLIPPAAGGAGQFGTSVALSGDARIALVGAGTDTLNEGATYVFLHTGDIWTQQLKLMRQYTVGDNPGKFGSAVALSADGNNALVGAFAAEEYTGAAYLYTLCVDLDGDAICDAWESEAGGIPVEGGSPYDLYALGARPNRKDVFVEVDAMAGLAPTQAALDRVIAAFAAAAVPPPAGISGGRKGIALHLVGINGQGRIDEAYLPPRDYPKGFADFREDKAVYFGTLAERTNPNWAHIKAAKGKVFRYCIFAKDELDGSSGATPYTPGNDLMVTLGFWDPPGAYVEIQAGTFMHELGHTLGLEHGGKDSSNFRPNYHSVMNYAWQFPRMGTIPGKNPWRLRYSEEVLAPLNESALDENTPIGSKFPGQKVLYNNGKDEIKYTRCDKPVDWDGDNEILAAPGTVEVDVNYFYFKDGPSPGEYLTGYNDCENLVYNFRTTGYYISQNPPAKTAGGMDWDTYVFLNSLPPPPPDCFTITGAVSVIGCPRGMATFAVTAAPTASGPFTYQWRKSTIPLTDGPTGSGSVVSGATSASLTLSGLTFDDEAVYDCVVTSPCDTLTSDDATLTFLPPAPADFNEDGVVDNSDLNTFTDCATGPAIPYDPLPPACTLPVDGNGRIAADFDHDGDVDQKDFGLFQRCLSGPNVPADPNCAI